MTQEENYTQRYRPGEGADVPQAPQMPANQAPAPAQQQAPAAQPQHHPLPQAPHAQQNGPAPQANAAPTAAPTQEEHTDTVAVRRRLQSQQPVGRPGVPVPYSPVTPHPSPAVSVGTMSGPITGPVTGATSGPVTAGGSGPTTRSSSRTGGKRTGMASMPPVEPRDPAEAVLADAKVSEGKRVCSSCGKKAGRAQAGRPGRTEGYCPHCRTRYWFTPSLRPGDSLADRYEVLGTIAHGGLGWIYLAKDTNFQDDLQDRWVVVKGLISTSDEDAVEAAINERRFLVGIDHPGVVNIIDFVTASDERSGEMQTYIVMEYLAGKSLRDIREEPEEDGTVLPMPLADTLTYTLEILPAFEYLHDSGLLFCDFKPDNVIHVQTWLKLIDLGAVRRIDDMESAVYGTPGYAVPNDEILSAGPSITSDLYTIGRSMAVMALDFKGFTKKYRNAFPPAEETELFRRFPSFQRLLQRTCNDEPMARFQDAAEMRTQVRGVLGEVESVEKGRPLYEASTLFSGEAAVFGVPDVENDLALLSDPQSVVESLPRPLPDPDDPATAFLQTVTASQPAVVLAELANAPAQTHEVRLRRVDALIDLGDLASAAQALGELVQSDGNTWQANWYAAILQLAGRDVAGAYTSFDNVFSHLPGELAPRLALAACAEGSGHIDTAAAHYERIWAVDRRFVSAAFGHARLLERAGRIDDAIRTLQQIPTTSSQYHTAQVAAIQLSLRSPMPPDMERLHHLGNTLTGLRLEPGRHHLVATRLLNYALHYLNATGTTGAPPVLGTDATERDLRFALESSYRSLAHAQQDREKQIHYIDLANTSRPRTLL
ncbi:tetratricopeptide repeat protein [Salininema proteolyticum]|uniref:non-specific serine/threonine protein kinase n=1 Tax=Salininema proteolyticum TaxID=1607685 RepID=A0ABV8U1Q0_9ACTN